jgi:hypothetical protein
MIIFRHLILILILDFTTSAIAQPNAFSDWPCKQVRVQEMSLSGILPGGGLETEKKAWRNDPMISDVATRISARRTPLSDAEKFIGDFAKNAGDQRKERMKLLLAATFETMNDERKAVVNGLDRFGRSLKELAEKTREETQALRDLQDRKPPEPEEIKKASDNLQWRLRLFDEQRRMVGFVCESPALIEQRFGALARAIITGME